MGTEDRLTSVDRWLTHGFWIQDIEGVARVVGLSIKAEPGQILAVVKGLGAEGPMVAFRQAKGLSELYNVLARGNGADELRWREDKFALDKK